MDRRRFLLSVGAVGAWVGLGGPIPSATDVVWNDHTVVGPFASDAFYVIPHRACGAQYADIVEKALNDIARSLAKRIDTMIMEQINGQA